MDSSKLARLLCSLKSEIYRDKFINDIDISTQVPDDLQIPEAGYNCLHLSVMKNDVQLMKKLVDKGADLIKQGSRNGYSPLCLFVRSKSYDNGKKITALIGKLGKEQMVDILLSEQVKNHNALNPKCFFGVSHLHIACMFDHLQAVDIFLKAGECVNQAISTSSLFLAGWAPLHIAVTYSSIAIVNLLFYYGANIHLKDALGKTPLHRLIKRQLDAMDNIKMGKRAIVTSIHRELKRTEMIIFSLLKTRKLDEVNFVDDAGLSAFHVACTLRDPSMAEEFLKGDVDINKPLNNNLICWAGWTPLHFAACCSIKTVKLLVQHGADIKIENTEGKTPFDFCMRRYSPAIIHSILSLKEEFSNILLSDQSTKLLDLILAMDNCDEFKTFLQNLSDINAIVPHDSPIWPGYSIFHLAISMHERTEDPMEYIEQFLNPEIFPKQYTCTETEEKNYWKRIVVCMALQCNLTTRDANGLTPVHLAFKLRKANVVDKLLNCSRTNETDSDGLSFLHMACAVGNKNAVERFSNDINNPVNGPFKWCREKRWLTVPTKSTPLHVAVTFDQREIVEYLLEKKANVYAQDSLGFTPIHLSAFSQPIASLFLGKITILKEVASQDGLSHLHVAAFVNDDTAIEKLLTSGAKVNVMSRTNLPLSKIDYLGQTPLHIAVKMGNLKAVRALIEAGADIHATSLRSKYDTPLQGAIMRDEMMEEFVKKLRREKQTKGPIEACGVTFLHFACAMYDVKWIKKLLDIGADPNAQICMDENYESRWKGYTPMHLLLIAAHLTAKNQKSLIHIVKLLLRHGANVTLQNDEGCTPLHFAEEIANLEMAREEQRKKQEQKEASQKTIKEEKGKKRKHKKTANEKEYETNDEKLVIMYSIADLLLKSQKSYAINPVNCHGSTHFHYACKRNNVEIVRKFIKSRVDVNSSQNIFELVEYSGFTALHFALDHQCFKLAKILLEHNADVKAKDFFDRTPLHIAAENNCDDVDLLETMWRMGADVNAKNINNDTPLDVLIRSTFITYDQLKFFFNHGCLIEFGEACDGIIGHLLRIGQPDHREGILRLLFEYCNLAEKIKNGFNAIQSFVSCPLDSNWTVDRYLGGIQFFMDMGCDIDQQNTFGKTALHDAAFHANVHALEALLLLGADMNILAPAPILHAWSSSVNLRSSSEFNLQRAQATTILSHHLWKLKYVRLDIESGCKKLAESLWKRGLVNEKLVKRCEGELEKMKQMKIGEKWIMADFLLESKLVIEYQAMSPSQRRSIDEIFKSHADLHQMFPEFCGLLMLQYRKAVSNVKLYWPVRNAITSLLKLELPDECLKGILSYLDKSEFKKLSKLNEYVSGKV